MRGTATRKTRSTAGGASGPRSLRARRRLLLALALALVLGAAGFARAGDPAPGKVVDVACEADPGQRYSCYLPRAYSPQKEWPILYCFSPNARGDAFVNAYREVCEERGWIVVGSMNSQNGPWEPIQAAIAAMRADTEKRLRLAKRARYASGFSGGARVSFAVAEMFPDEISGVIAIGAGLHSGGAMPGKGLAVWLMCGEEDMNRGEIEALGPKLKAAGNPVETRLFPGGHTMPPGDLMTEAVRWMDDRSAARREALFAAALAEAKDRAEKGEAGPAWLGLIDAIAAYPDQAKASPEAARLRKDLEREPAVKEEIKALDRLQGALDWIERNRDRIVKSESVRAQAQKKLDEVGEKHPGTRAAAQAAERRKALGGGNE